MRERLTFHKTGMIFFAGTPDRAFRQKNRYQMAKAI